MIRIAIALIVACASAASLVQLSNEPAPVIATPYSAHLLSVVGTSQYLVTEDGATIGWCDKPQHAQTLHGREMVAHNVTRTNGHFESTRDDIDVTWYPSCPE